MIPRRSRRRLSPSGPPTRRSTRRSWGSLLPECWYRRPRSARSARPCRTRTSQAEAERSWCAQYIETSSRWARSRATRAAGVVRGNSALLRLNTEPPTAPLFLAQSKGFATRPSAATASAFAILRVDTTSAREMREVVCGFRADVTPCGVGAHLQSTNFLNGADADTKRYTFFHPHLWILLTS